jgi:uncharacterized protein YdeI (YjbR/CyaY-like superfamily)
MEEVCMPFEKSAIVENGAARNAIRLRSVEEWRDWLHEFHDCGKSVWLIIYHKNSGVPSVRWNDAIEHALCYGWVDSKARKRDNESCYLRFTPRNPKSKWGKRNKERAQRMIDGGLMMEAGYELIRIAKSTGKWDTDGRG